MTRTTAVATEYRAFLGIDPGLDGAIAVLTPGLRTTLAWACPTPTYRDDRGRRQFDRAQMVSTLRTWSDCCAAIEKVNAAPMHGRRQGTTGMFRFGFGYGIWMGVLESLGIPVIEVDPRRWKRVVLKGLGSDKEAAIRYCQTCHPDVNLLAKKRSRKPHDGMADALCIAEYGRRTWTERALVAGR